MQRYNIVNGVTSDSEESATTNQEGNDAPLFPDLYLYHIYIYIIYYCWLFIFTEKGVPNFWLYALRGNGVMNDEVRCFCVHKYVVLTSM